MELETGQGGLCTGRVAPLANASAGSRWGTYSWPSTRRGATHTGPTPPKDQGAERRERWRAETAKRGGEQQRRWQQRATADGRIPVDEWSEKETRMRGGT